MGRIVKDPKKIEVIAKGFANYRRVQIIFLLGDKDRLPKNGGLSVNEIADELRMGFRSASQHLDKMYRGGLVGKRYQGPAVIHYLTQRGINTLIFFGRFER